MCNVTVDLIIGLAFPLVRADCSIILHSFEARYEYNYLSSTGNFNQAWSMARNYDPLSKNFKNEYNTYRKLLS